MGKVTITIKEGLRAYNELSTIKLSKFDKDLRKAAVRNYAELSKVSKENQAYQEDVKERLFADMKEEITVVSELRSRMSAAKTREELAEINKDIICNHSAFLKTEEEYGNILKDKENETIEVDLSTVDMDKWIDALVTAEIDFTPTNINNLNCMFN